MKQPNQQQPLEQAITRHFESQKMPDFEGYLYTKVVRRLEYEQQIKALKPKLWAAVSIFAVSLVLLVIASESFYRAMVQTPAWQFLSLLLTDFGQVTSNWQDYALSVLENLPLGNLAFLLLAVLSSVWLIDFAAAQLNSWHRLANHN